MNVLKIIILEFLEKPKKQIIKGLVIYNLISF